MPAPTIKMTGTVPVPPPRTKVLTVMRRSKIWALPTLSVFLTLGTTVLIAALFATFFNSKHLDESRRPFKRLRRMPRPVIYAIVCFATNQLQSAIVGAAIPSPPIPAIASLVDKALTGRPGLLFVPKRRGQIDRIPPLPALLLARRLQLRHDRPTTTTLAPGLRSNASPAKPSNRRKRFRPTSGTSTILRADAASSALTRWPQ